MYMYSLIQSCMCKHGDKQLLLLQLFLQYLHHALHLSELLQQIAFSHIAGWPPSLVWTQAVIILHKSKDELLSKYGHAYGL